MLRVRMLLIPGLLAGLSMAVVSAGERAGGRANRRAVENDSPRSGGGSELTWTEWMASGWLDRSRRLYALAAEAARKTAGQ